MRYVATHHQPTAVVDSVRGQFTGPGAYTLAVAKVNKIELYDLADDGLRYLCGLEIWGQVSNIQEVQREERSSALLVTTDHPTPYVLVLEYAGKPAPSLSVIKYDDLRSRSGRSARSGRIAEYCQYSVVHAPSELFVTSAYTGSLDIGTTAGTEKSVELRMPEQTLVAFTFLPTSSSSDSHSALPTLAIIHVDINGDRRLLTRSLLEIPLPGSNKRSLSRVELSPPTAHITERVLKDFEGEIIVSVPPKAPGIKPGILVLGEGKAVWYAVRDDGPDPSGRRRSSSSTISPDKRRDKGKGRASMDTGKALAGRLDHCAVKLKRGKIAAATYVGFDRVIYGDEFGALVLLWMDRRPSDGFVSSMQRFDLGEVSSPCSITHLSGPFFYIGSKCGDSQLIRILGQPSDPPNSTVEVVRTHPNLAPIIDFIVTDPEKIVQSQIVTCSGRQNCGSLRVIRSGVAFDELAVIDEISNVKPIFRIRSGFDSLNDAYLVLTRISRTSLYSFDGEGSSVVLEEIDAHQAPGLIRNSPTLACSNVKAEDGRLVLQVTPESVVALDAINWSVKYKWDADQEIVAAALNGESGVIALKGGLLRHFTSADTGLNWIGDWSPPPGDPPEEVSCIAVDPTLHSGLEYYAVVGFWSSNRVQIFDISNGFTPMEMVSPLPQQPHVPLSIILTTFGDHEKPYLLVGLGNGTVSSYTLTTVPDAEDALLTRVAIDESRSFSWGTMPVSLSLCRDLSKGWSVFACGDRPALLFLKNGRLTASPIKLRDIQGGSILNCRQFPNCFIFSTKTSLMIGQIKELQKLDVRAIPLGLDTPIRIAYHSSLRAYGVVCHRKDFNRESGRETESSSFKLFDDLTFEHINNFNARPDELIMCVGTIPDVTKPYETEFFVLGTYETSAEEMDAGRGRILVFEEDANRKISLATTVETEGAVYGVAYVGSVLAAAVNGTVRIYSIESKAGQVTLRLSHTWASAYVATSLVAHGDTLVVGDAMRSVCLLRWTGSKLDTIYHDYSSLWIQTVESLEDGSVIASDINNNIVSWRRNTKLEQDGTWYLGEGINRYRIASLTPTTTSGDPQTRLIFCTNAGRIGVIIPLEQSLSMDMIALEHNLGITLEGPGNVEHDHRRKPQATPGLPAILTTKNASGFIDGDFVERFLDFDPKGVAQVMAGRTHALKKPYSHYVGLLEELQRLH